ncbi:hypothetical protein AMS68_003313 [Peltaster fructicola]|uniref:Uncharacterized protein n=1 Tax=Peltaster fructicola TaxID=286661 RepID=A0A6H0XSZ2_9PEZI|nr:hypothetical protein AMS68_003313 [Peltaster fructicola]
MDGLLLNTEDLITQCINTILSRYDKPELPWSIKARIQGRSARDSNVILLNWAQLPITENEYVEQLKGLHDEVFPTAEPLPGVQELLKELSENNVALALATSSTRQKFAIKTVTWTSLFACFPEDCRVLGDDARVAKHKPAPDIYLRALRCLDEKISEPLTAAQCLVFEDSIQGVDAGRRAGMAVVWCPHPGLLHELLEGAIDDVRTHFQGVFGLSDSVKHMSNENLAELITKTSNGWIRLVLSLEDFPYHAYRLSR